MPLMSFGSVGIFLIASLILQSFYTPHQGAFTGKVSKSPGGPGFLHQLAKTIPPPAPPVAGLLTSVSGHRIWIWSVAV